MKTYLQQEAFLDICPICRRWAQMFSLCEASANIGNVVLARGCADCLKEKP